MSWRDQLRPGSFRGVPFYIEEATTQVGRRTVLNEYPLRDKPWPEDLGQRADQFYIDCLVIGSDYMTARDALIAALKTKGAGTLVHPYYGSMSVVVTQPASIRESTREGGVARFRIPFAESGDNVQPAATADTAQQLQTNAAAAGDQAASSFASQYSLNGAPSWLSDVAGTQLSDLTTRLASLRDGLPGIPSAVTDFNQLLHGFSDTLSSLIREPFNLGASVVSLVFGLGTMLRQPLDALDLYKQLFGYTVNDNSTPVVTSTPTRAIQLANTQALQTLVRNAAVTQAAATVASVPAQTTTQTQLQTVSAADGSTTLAPTPVTVNGFDAVGSAIDARDTLVDAIDTQLLMADDDLYPLLEDVRSALVTDINTRVATLPTLVGFSLATTLPALVVAFRLYADAAREADIVARNTPPYPGFISGGQVLEVLSD